MQQLTIGTLLRGGLYKIEKVLGQGSFGITYLAEHTNLGRKVAIKEFFMKELNSRGEDGSITGMTDGSLSQNYCVKFQKEAINLSRLDYPNIVRVTDSFSENGTFYYVMDYIEGQDLNDYVKSHHVDEAEATSIIKSIADALIYMHEEKHMLHLDLKPGNVMRRNSDGHIFLIDFGLSKHFSEDGQPETSTTIGLGTTGYAPIEQGNRAKNGEFRPTIDVYALGATFYKLLTRETPPPASDLVSDDELLENNLRAKGVSDNLVTVVVEAMCPNVRKRTQTIRDFKSNLNCIKIASPTSNVNPNNTFDGTDKDETIVASANNSNSSSDSEETSFANAVVQDEKSQLVKEYMEAFNVEEKEATLYVNTHGMNATIGAIAAKIAGNTVSTQIPTNGKVNSHKTEESKSNDSKKGCIVAAFCIIVFFAFLFGITRGCGNKTAQIDESVMYMDSDTVCVDTMAADIDTVSADNVIEVSCKSKGGWRHSGTVITNYNEDAGVPVCRAKIDKNNACKNGCLVGSGRAVVVIGKNSFACEGISNNIKSIFEQYKANGSRINDIAITPSGKYVIIEENNGFSNNTGIPDLDKELNRANSARETIYSVSLADNGKWAVITDKYYSSNGWKEEIDYAVKKYDEVYSVSMTNKGVVICCRKGIYYKNIPKNVSDNISDLYWIPKYIKFTDGGVFLATDGKSAYTYCM